jgi:penicillin-binding protein 1C
LNFLHRLGIESLKQPADYYGLSLALGAGEISLYELTRAYSVLANEGKLCDIQLIEGNASPCEQVVDENLIQDIVNILSNRYYKLGSFPLNSNADFPNRFVALKTGTSRNFSDTRAMGFTRRYIIGVRVGNKDGSNMESVSGIDGAGYLFKQIVELLEPTETLAQAPLVQGQSQEYVQITSPLN